MVKQKAKTNKNLVKKFCERTRDARICQKKLQWIVTVEQKF